MMGTGLLIVGQCQACNCTDALPCADPHTGLPCEWVDDEHSFCSVCALFAGGMAMGAAPGTILCFGGAVE